METLMSRTFSAERILRAADSIGKDDNTVTILHDVLDSIHSVIDFGDSNYNPLVYELAITIMYMMTRCSSMSPSLAGGHVIAGYIRHRQLSALERRLIRICVASR